jgi:site-specific DNA-cytosine methylase
MLDEGPRSRAAIPRRPSSRCGLCRAGRLRSGRLLARMEEQSLEPAPVWAGNLEAVGWRSWHGVVDCITAGFPCQPWSAAGKRDGEDDERWIWPDIARIISEVEPPLCWLENVRGLVSGGGLELVLADLAARGFDAKWGVLPAAAVGASHERERVFILAYHHSEGRGLLERIRSSLGSSRNADRRDARMGDAGLERRQARFSDEVGLLRALAGEGGHELANAEGRGEGPVAGSAREGILLNAGNGGGVGDATSGGQRELRHACRARSCGHADCADGHLANTDGAAVWKQGRQLREEERGSGRALPPRPRESSDAMGDAEHSAPRNGNSGEQIGTPVGERCRVLGSTDAGGVLANAERDGVAGRRGSGDMGGAAASGVSEASERQRDRHAADDSGDDMANAGGARSEGRELGRELPEDTVGRSRDVTHGSVTEFCSSHLFAPGPSAPIWPEFLRLHPYAAPAIESGLRVLVDGVAVVVDESRADQLRCGGNGVVALQAGCAVVLLAHRALAE